LPLSLLRYLIVLILSLSQWSTAFAICPCARKVGQRDNATARPPQHASAAAEDGHAHLLLGEAFNHDAEGAVRAAPPACRRRPWHLCALRKFGT